MVVTHLIPDFLKPGAGNWKDIVSRELVLQSMKYLHRVELKFNIHDPTAIVNQIPNDTAFALIEYSWWPELQQSIKKKHPNCKILVRAHNAEGFQNYAHHGFKILPTYKNLQMYYGCARNAWRDHQSCNHADFILGISPWDSVHYWRYLGSKEKIIDLPYYCPWPYLNTNVVSTAWEKRRNAILSFPGMTDRIGLDMQNCFESFIIKGMLDKNALGWEFHMSGGLGGSRKINNDIPISILPEPLDAWQVLHEHKVLAVLGDKGFGMKTNIIDGIAAGCHVLVNSRLYNKLPENIKACCTSVNMNDKSTNKQLWHNLEQQPSYYNTNMNSLLKNECAMTLNKIFGKLSTNYLAE